MRALRVREDGPGLLLAVADVPVVRRVDFGVVPREEQRLVLLDEVLLLSL